MVCVTIAWTVANESFVACGWGLINGIANKVIGKHTTITAANMPNNISIEFVVIFIMHLQFVQEMDDEHLEKVPYKPHALINLGTDILQ